LKKIRTDAGSEYLCRVVDDFCSRNHILHNAPPGCNPNGVAARASTGKTYLQKVPLDHIHVGVGSEWVKVGGAR